MSKRTRGQIPNFEAVDQPDYTQFTPRPKPSPAQTATTRATESGFTTQAFIAGGQQEILHRRVD